MKHTAGAIVLLLTVGACSSSVTSSDEYQQLVTEKSTVEANLVDAEADRDAATSRAETAEAAADEAQATITESAERIADLEGDVTEFRDQIADAQAELETWVAFAGSPNDEAFLWSQEYFELAVRTCMADGSSELDCVCMLEEIEIDVSLMDLLLTTELYAGVELGVVGLNPVTGLPDGFPSDVGALFGSAFLTCFG